MSTITKLKILLILNSIQGIITLILLANRRSNVMHAVLFNYSTKKLILLSFVLILDILIFWLCLKVYFCQRRPNYIQVLFGFINKFSWLFYLLIFFTWFLYLYLRDKYPAYLSITWPILLWIGIFLIEVILLRDRNESGLLNFPTTPVKWLNEKLIGYGFLLVTAVIGHQLRFINTFADEGDHIANGWLISNGYVLYRDIFSHHPPLINYWVGWIIELFGENISSIRFSVIIFQICIFAISAYITKYYIPLGLTSLIWVIISPFYFGNLAIYQVFSGALIVASISSFISIVGGEPTTKKFIWLGISNGLLISNDPQMIWPILFIYLGVLISMFLPNNRLKLALNTKRLFISLMMITVIGVAWLIYFWSNGALDELIDNLVIFNTEIYSKYTYSTIFRFPEIIKNGFNLLSINDHRWFRDVGLSPLNFYMNPDETIYTGFFYRLTILGFVLYLIVNKKFLLGFTIYFVVCSLFPRSDTWFHSIPFVYTALFLFSFQILKISIPSKNNIDMPATTYHNNFVSNLYLSFKLVTLFLCIILIFKSVSGVIKNKEFISYDYNFGWLEAESQFISKYSCGIDNWHYANYPLNPLMYFFLEKQPVSKFTFMTPWVAEVGQEEVIQTLEQSNSNIISIWEEGAIWGYRVDEYLSDLIKFLAENYIEVSPNLWVSPDIYQFCNK